MKSLLPFVPVIATTFILIVSLWGMHWLLIKRHKQLGGERLFPRQLMMLGLTLFSIIIITLVLPIDEGSRNQIITLIGLLASGVFAFSSTTVVANLMAGLLIRVTQPFRTGDFIRVGEHFGRVAEKGLFDTEIQSETSELIAIPNTYIITHPVATVRSSGTIISVDLSLGYDVHHSRIEPLLIQAAGLIGLQDPFVHIITLGDHSIAYRVSGLLVDVKGLITARSDLYRAVLDTLHADGIEITSPSFMNQRQLSSEQRTIPQVGIKPRREEKKKAEEVVFEKAEQAEQVENEMQALEAKIQQLEESLKYVSADEKERVEALLKEGREQLDALHQTELDT